MAVEGSLAGGWLAWHILVAEIVVVVEKIAISTGQL